MAIGRLFSILLFPLIFISEISFGQEMAVSLKLTDELTQFSNSIVLDESIEIDASNIKKIKIKTHRIVMVLNELGKGDIRAYENYNDETRIKKISAEIYDGQGNRIKRFKQKDFMDVSRSGSNMYHDSRLLYVDYTPTIYPFIAVFESEVETGDSGLFPDRWFVRGYGESLLKSRMEITYSSDNKLRYKPKNLEGYDISIFDNPNEFIVEAKNIPALRYEEYSPSFDKIFPHILLAFDNFQIKRVPGQVQDWNSFGTWMDKALLGDVNQVSAVTLNKINQLIADESTNEAKARKIYQYVQDKVRYVSIQIGLEAGSQCLPRKSTN